MNFNPSSILALVLLFGIFASTLGAQEIPFPDKPTKRVAAQDGWIYEWRDAVEFPPQLRGAITLNPSGHPSWVRLGILDARDRPVHITILQGDRPVQSLATDGSGLWQDQRIKLLDPDGADPKVYITLQSDSSFYVSTAELVSNSAARPNVVIFLIDTLRQDHLGCYGYHRDTSPNIDVFAKDATRFTQLVPSSSWTRPSVASLLTSTYPNVHGARDRGDSVRNGLRWLARVLAEAGYETHGIMTNINCLPMWGFGHDFFRYRDEGARRWYAIDDADAVATAQATLRDARGRPAMLYVHTLSPHEPYKAPEPFNTRFVGVPPHGRRQDAWMQKSIDAYDGEIAYVDEQFGALMRTMKELDLYDSSIIILLSDHGEEFGEHGGISHGKTLFEEQLRVPLLIKFPNNERAGSTLDLIVEMVDIAPTILDLLDLPAEPAFQGRSIFESIEHGERRVGYASLQLDDKSIESAKTQNLKFIHDLPKHTKTWYDLQTDPGELHPIDAPSPDGLLLARAASQKARFGKEGLHLLLTHDSKRDIVIDGQVRVQNIVGAELDYPQELASIVRTPQGLRFTATMPKASRPSTASTQWNEAVKKDRIMQIFLLNSEALKSEQDHLELLLYIEPEQDFTLSLNIDGKPIERHRVFIGAQGRHVQLEDGSIPLADLIAQPNTYDPAALPTGLALYLWYVPPTRALSDEELDPDVREALEGLGYIN